MKKIYLIIACVVLLAVSCIRETLQQDFVRDVVPVASSVDESIPNGWSKLLLDAEDTKTAMAGLSVVWEEGDSIAVNGDRYPIKTDSDGRKYVLAPSSTLYEAFFPAEVWGEDGPLIQPAQYFVSGSFGKKANYMSAATASETLTFSHLLGILKLTVKGKGTIASINVRDNAGGSMCGQYRLSDGVLSPEGTVQYDNVTLNCKTTSNGGVALSTSGKDFYIVVPARTYSAGLTITISEVNGHAMVLNSATPRTLAPGHILTTPPISYSYDSTQIYEYHMDNLVLGADPVAGKRGFAAKDKSKVSGFDLCDRLTRTTAEEGTLNFSEDATVNGDFSNVGVEFARTRNIQVWKKVYYTTECHGYMACGLDGSRKASYKLPALANAGNGFFKVEYSWKMAFRSGHVPAYGIQILHTSSTPGKVLELYVDGRNLTGSMTDGTRWCSTAGDSGEPILKDGTYTEERLLIRPGDFGDYQWHDVKVVLGMATKATVLEFSAFGSDTDQPFFIDDVCARRIEYNNGVGAFTLREPTTSQYAWNDSYALQPSMQINPNSTTGQTFLKNFHSIYGIKYVDYSMGSSLLFKTWNVNTLDDAGWKEADAKIAAIKELLDGLGIKIWSIHLPYQAYKEGYVSDSDAFSFCCADESSRQAAVDRTKIIMTHLAVLEPKYMLVHPNRFTPDMTFDGYSGGGWSWSTWSYTDKVYYKDQGVKSFKALVAHANSIRYSDNTHPVLIVENVCNTGGSSSTIGASISHLNWFCSQVPGLGVCLDTGHAIVNHCNTSSSTDGDISSLVAALGSNLKHIHVHGNDPANDKDLHLMPGYAPGSLVLSYSTTDKIQWGKFYKALIDSGYRGTFCYEYSSPEYGGDYRDCIANFHNIYHNYFDFMLQQYISVR